MGIRSHRAHYISSVSWELVDKYFNDDLGIFDFRKFYEDDIEPELRKCDDNIGDEHYSDCIREVMDKIIIRISRSLETMRDLYKEFLRRYPINDEDREYLNEIRSAFDYILYENRDALNTFIDQRHRRLEKNPQ